MSGNDEFISKEERENMIDYFKNEIRMANEYIKELEIDIGSLQEDIDESRLGILKKEETIAVDRGSMRASKIHLEMLETKLEELVR